MGLFVTGIENVPPAAKGGAITIGNFDGVHRGHRELVSRLRRMADQISGPAVVLTFDPPPAQLLRPDSAPPSLTWMDRRAEILFQLGIDVVCICRTTELLLELSADAFFEEVLVQKLAVAGMVEGPNFRFGKDRLGDIDLLNELCQQNSVQLSIASGQAEDGEWISSSRIRALIAQGDMLAANRLLVEPYRLHGIVGHGAARGRTIGFPTANLEQVPVLIPPHGVYAGRAFVEGQTILAALSIGPNPTFKDATSKVEVHLLDFSGDLYGKEFEVELLERIRGIIQFSSTDELVEQLKTDIQKTRKIAT
ncbi:MAG: bifunctional riboflavin kinase/FAD synthetase [Pirellulaceae bacterium]|nr:bifunctional riboflavin kinase/FAD synthetase [Pirellulaceae bacterium]